MLSFTLASNYQPAENTTFTENRNHSKERSQNEALFLPEVATSKGPDSAAH
jgi:hypothetical protein